MDKIRNFCIIAHIDHGKSTIADRILELTGAVSKRDLAPQLLDNMELEKERGITIKLNAVELYYKDYTLHLIDTPGHVDFSYEVSRSLAACEGALLIVDATKGIQAQTLANLYLALNSDLVIIPVINKIDLPNADIPKVKKELIEVLGFKDSDILLCSGKTGEGILELLDAVIDNVPAPGKTNTNETKALIFDSVFDSYRGVIALVCVKNGNLKKGDTIVLMNSKSEYEIIELGVNTPKEKKVDELGTGAVGYIIANIKSIDKVHVGDTITTKRNMAKDPLTGYKSMKPMVYSGLYPVEPNKYEVLKEALEKLKLNDASLIYELETSEALGFGFRCGFLGLLHLDIIKERIRREYNLEIITTNPSVVYQVILTNGETVNIDNPTKMPPRVKIKEIKEPYVLANIFVTTEYIGSIMELCQEKRGIYITTEYIDQTRINITYELPLAEIVYDFFDKLKSYTKGYASFDYELSEYKVSDLIKMDILINGEIVDALSIIVHSSFAYNRGKIVIENLKELIPRQLFQIPIQASIGSKVIARENISAMRKNVLAKCYGGDVTRKKKLLEKQKEGKKRMKMVGNVEIPPEAFLSILKTDK